MDGFPPNARARRAGRAARGKERAEDRKGTCQWHVPRSDWPERKRRPRGSPPRLTIGARAAPALAGANAPAARRAGAARAPGARAGLWRPVAGRAGRWPRALGTPGGVYPANVGSFTQTRVGVNPDLRTTDLLLHQRIPVPDRKLQTNRLFDWQNPTVCNRASRQIQSIYYPQYSALRCV